MSLKTEREGFEKNESKEENNRTVISHIIRSNKFVFTLTFAWGGEGLFKLNPGGGQNKIT